MPQASDERRAQARKWFGDNADWEAIKFLEARGWIEQGGLFTKPTPSYNPSIYEVEALLYLRDEWDFDFQYPLFPELEKVLP